VVDSSGRHASPSTVFNAVGFVSPLTWCLQDQAALTQAIRDYFTNERLEPKGAPMTDEAWRFQGHLILHLLNDDVIAVPRSELLGSLVRGTTCTFDKESMQWIFKVGTHAARSHLAVQLICAARCRWNTDRGKRKHRLNCGCLAHRTVYFGRG
jgi:hypothetical protein